MEPECPPSGRETFDKKKEIKTENDPVKPVSPQNNGRQPIDEIERQDFDEENRILKHCSGMIVDGKGPAHYSGNLSSANSSLASSSEAISNLSNLTHDYNLPGCSKDGDDSNTTIKNMINSKKYAVHEQKEDFMQKLLNSNTEEKKDFPKGKLYKGDKLNCENDEVCDMDASGPSGRTSSNASSIGSTSSDSTKGFSVPSTSNADKLLGLDDSRKNEPGSSKKNVVSVQVLFKCGYTLILLKAYSQGGAKGQRVTLNG